MKNRLSKFLLSSGLLLGAQAGLHANPTLTGSTSFSITVDGTTLTGAAGTDIDAVTSVTGEQTLTLSNLTGSWDIQLRRTTETVNSNFILKYRVENAQGATVDEGSAGNWYTVNTTDTQILSRSSPPDGTITISYEVSNLTVDDEVEGSPTIDVVYTLTDQSV